MHGGHIIPGQSGLRRHVCDLGHEAVDGGCGRLRSTAHVGDRAIVCTNRRDSAPRHEEQLPRRALQDRRTVRRLGRGRQRNRGLNTQ